MNRCFWCNLDNKKYIDYHDDEWGRLNLNDSYLFEMLILESFQAGLSWECVLNKRDAFREAYDYFDLQKVCSYQEEKVQELIHNKELIRNRLKIYSSIENAKIFRSVQNEYHSFSNYLMSFTHGKILYENNKTTNSLSDKISNDLKKRGMKFVGSTIIYSYLQAIGLIQSHTEHCDLYQNKKIRLHIPKLEEYSFEQELYHDSKTMSYNAGYDVSYDGYHYDTGCIDFPQKVWEDKFNERKKGFFAYIEDEMLKKYVGATYLVYQEKEKHWECGVIINYPYRHKGYAKDALYLLCYQAKKMGISEIYDNFEKSREGVLPLFQSLGFDIVEEQSWNKFHKKVDGILVRKVL